MLFDTGSKEMFSLPCLHSSKTFVIFAGPRGDNLLYPLWGKCYRGARRAKSFDLVEGAMDNATPAITNNTRMEKRIALECGKRKPDEVELQVF